jgi:tetratricopeptide (TPR) repeat protein
MGADLIFVDPEGEAHHKEIIVEKDEIFTVRLKGGGWYLNRYDSENLVFKLRTAEPGYTDFMIHPVGENPGYLFFSYLENDMYIRVKIEDPGSELKTVDETLPAESPSVEGTPDERSKDERTPVEIAEAERSTEEGAPVEITEAEFPQAENAPEEKILTENLQAETDTAIKEEDIKGTNIEKTVPEDADIYYITKDKEIVKVPSVNEEMEYRKGIKYFKKEDFDKASEHFLEYLSGCVSCDYKDDARFKTAEIYIKQDKKEEAVRYLDELIELGTEEYKVLAGRIKADLYFEAGRFGDALEGYKTVLLYDSEDIAVLKNTGDIYYHFKDYVNALVAYEQGIERGLSEAEVFFRVASMYDGSGKHKDIEKAYKFYKVILKLFPDFDHYNDVEKRVSFMEKNFFNYE